MDSVTVSPKFQVVIPRNIREKVGIKPGQKMQVIAIGNKVLLISEARESLKGVDSGFQREEEDEERS